MTNVDLILTTFAVTLGGIVQGVSGFGFSLIAVPILVVILPPLEIIPSVLILSILINSMILFETGWKLEFRKIAPIIASSSLGLPLGVLMLDLISQSILRILIGVLTCVLCTLMISGFRHSFKHKRLATFFVGIVSGAMNSSITMSGPPVVLYWTNELIEKPEFRKYLAAYFLVLNIATLPIYWYLGFLTRGVFSFCASEVVVLLFSVGIGIFISRRIDQNQFKRLTLALVWIISIASIISGIRTFPANE